MRRTLFLIILRLFGLPPSSFDIKKKGLIIILIDGLSYTSLKLAIEKKYCSFFSSLLKKEYKLNNYYCGPPAATTVTEAELFFGSHDNIPGFSWFDRNLMMGIRGNNASTIEQYEKSLKMKPTLLQNGSCIGGVYSAGASQFSLSSRDLQFKHPLGTLFKLFYVFFIFLNPVRLFLTWYLIIKSIIISLITLLKKHSKKYSFTTLKDSLSRIFLGNMLTYIAELEIVRESPILFIDYLLYDEFAHEYGVDSKISLSSLRLIDWYSESLYKLSKKTKRKYDVLILSDHGQTPSLPLQNIQQSSLEEMIRLTLNDRKRNIIKTFFHFNNIDKNSTSLYLVPGGSAIHLYFSETLEKPMYMDEIMKKYPLFISNLLKEKSVGWVMVRKNKNIQMLIGKHGAVEFELGKIARVVASPFLNNRIDDRIVQTLAQYALYVNNGDLIIYGNINNDGKLIAFEEHKGTHGGFYGDMNFPFIMTNIADVNNQVVKNNNMHDVFQTIRDTYSTDKL